MPLKGRPIIEFEQVLFQYPGQSGFSLTVDAFRVAAKQHVFLEGPSGSGKSTFLALITGLLRPSSGKLRVLGTDLTALSNRSLDAFRVDHFGIIFQLFNLIPYLSVLENVMLPCLFSTLRKQKVLAVSNSVRDEAVRLCLELDIDASLQDTSVTQLSIGQQQRVAIARALIGQPEIMIADEPTSALDSTRKELFLDLLFDECEKYRSTLIFVSHDSSIQRHFSVSVSMSQMAQPVRKVLAPCR